jgi:hypothetical protein
MKLATALVVAAFDGSSCLPWCRRTTVVSAAYIAASRSEVRGETKASFSPMM